MQVTAHAGAHHIHGGIRGFHKHMWQVGVQGECLVFSRLSPHNEEGYPGNMRLKVTISWEGNSLLLRYWAKSDRDTILNLTNHSYFNLDGKVDIQAHFLQIRADSYTVADAPCIPTGQIAPVENTAMDFRSFHTIGSRADAGESCAALYGGYDSNFILTGEDPAVIAYSEKSGITLSVSTDQPGVKLYTANGIAPRTGKGGLQYGHRCGFCLETQRYPDCIHHSD